MYLSSIQTIRYILATVCFALGVCWVFLGTEPALAVFQDINQQTQVFAGNSGAGFTVTDDPRVVVSRVIRVITSLLGLLFFVYTVYGGVLIFLSQGNPDEMKKGKSTIVTGAIGVLIMLTAYTITLFVSNALMYSAGAERCTDQWCTQVLPGANNPDPLSAPSDDGTQAANFWRSVFFGGNNP